MKALVLVRRAQELTPWTFHLCLLSASQDLSSTRILSGFQSLVPVSQSSIQEYSRPNYDPQSRGSRYLRLALLSTDLQPDCIVIRSGVPTRIPSKDLVVGDVLSIQTGVRVPADARVITGQLALNSAQFRSWVCSIRTRSRLPMHNVTC